MFDNGFKNIISIDTDSTVVNRLRKRNLSKRPDLKFECHSATDVSYRCTNENIF